MSGKCQKAKDGSASPQGRKRHRQNFSNKECPYAPNGQAHCWKRLNIVWAVKDPSRMLQRVSIVMSEQKTIKSILMNLHPVQSMTAPVRKKNFIAIRSSSGAPYPQDKCWQSSEKLKMKNYGRKRNSRKALPKKGQRGQECLFRRWTTNNADAYLFFVVGTRSEYEVITILPTVRSIAAFFIFLNFTSVFELAYLRFSFSALSENCVAIMSTQERNNVGVKRWKNVLLAAQDRKIERCPVNSAGEG